MSFRRKREKAPADVRWYRRAAFALPMSVAVLGGGVAGAYFISGGSGTGTSNVTTASAPASQAITVQNLGSIATTQAQGGTGTLVPLTPAATESAADEQTAIFGLFLPSGTTAQINTLTPSVTTGTGANSTFVVNKATGSPVVGCLASWFNIDPATLNNGANTAASFSTANNAALPTVITGASGTTALVGVNVWLKDSGTNQNACAGISPELTLSVS